MSQDPRGTGRLPRPPAPADGSETRDGSWAEVDRLLAAARSLPPDQRRAWIEQLDAAYDPLKPTLRVLLARSAQGPNSEFARTEVQPATPGGAAGALQVVPAAAADEPAPGSRVGRYRLVRELGAGGMGSVWLAVRADVPPTEAILNTGTRDAPTRFALKLPHFLERPGLAERLARERDILAALDHPGIARLYDAGVDAAGLPFIAMEFIEGERIDDWCRNHDAGLDDRLLLVMQVAEAVAHAHARKVLHRDLKPDNAMVTDDGQAKLLDFGIAKLMVDGQAHETQLTLVAGRPLTPDYSPPEQIFGQALTTASDVYSLGVMAFELVAGDRPYRYQDPRKALLKETLDRPNAPLASEVARHPDLQRALRGDLDAILAKALRKDPVERYPTVAALASDLARHLRGRPVKAMPDSLWYRLSKLAARDRLSGR